jgi:hypothetical protein
MQRPANAWSLEIPGIAALFAVLSCAMAWPLPVRLADALPSATGDPVLVAWTLGWGADRLADGYRGLWQAPIFHPYADTFAYSEAMLGVSVFLAPVYWLTRNPVLLHNLAFLAGPALAGTGMFLLVRELTGRRGAALVAALVYAFTPYRVSQATHLQVLVYGWMPLALLGLHRYLRTGSRRALALFALCFLLQSLSNGYFLYFLALAAAPIVGHGLWRAGGAWRHRAGGLAIAGLVILTVLAPVIAAYVRVARREGFRRDRAEMVGYSADLGSYFHVDAASSLWGSVLPTKASEATLFPGLLACVLAVLALGWAWHTRRMLPGLAQGDETPRTRDIRSAVAVYGAVTLLGIALTFGPEPAVWPGRRLPTGPWAWLLHVLPGFDGLRVCARAVVIVNTGLAVLAGCGMALLASAARPRLGALVTVLACCVVLAEGHAATRLESMDSPSLRQDRAVYAWLAGQPPGAMLELPAGEVAHEVRYVLGTLDHPNRIVNGYSGHGSALHEFVAGPPFREVAHLDGALEMLQAVGVRYVVVHGALYGDRGFADDLRAALRSAPRVVRAYDIGTTSVFELAAGATRQGVAPAGRRIEAAALALAASANPEAVARLADGDPQTRWLSVKPQEGTEWVRVDLDRPRTLTHLRLGTARRSLGDYPRHLRVETSTDGQSFTPVFDGSALPSLAAAILDRPASPSIDVPLPGVAARAVRISQTGRTPRRWFWAIHELDLWEAAER